ncbi:MAG: amidohydrolase family protein [Chloroflexota bacterium]
MSKRVLILAAVVALAACVPSGPAPSGSPTASAGPQGGSVVIVGRIVTLDEPPIAEALLIENGTVTAIGSRDEVLALAGDHVPVMDIGQNVAYPGFIDAHAHWIGDRDYYGLDSAEEAMDAALRRGWTSISEQWVNPERLTELETLAADNALRLRVDAYLTLNEPQIGGEHFGDWYADREPGSVSDHLRVRGLKIHLDTGFELDLLWEADELTPTVVRASQAGWQVAIHTFSDEAQEMALDAFEAAIGPSGPNPLHHRTEHAVQVTDAQLARMVAMEIAVVIHLDTAVADWLSEPNWMAAMGGETSWLARWRDFVDAGLHAAGATDMPWILPDFELTDDIGRPVDQIAGGMDPIGRVYPEPPAWMAAQLLTAEQGLRAVTLDAAYALGDEGRRGQLAVGMLGDVTILSGDVTTATPDEIRAMTVIGTIIGGVVEFCAGPEVCSLPEG